MRHNKSLWTILHHKKKCICTHAISVYVFANALSIIFLIFLWGFCGAKAFRSMPADCLLPAVFAAMPG